MTQEALPEDLRRFILASIPSVPFIEALLLFRSEARPLPIPAVARRLYVKEAAASELVDALAAAQAIEPVPEVEGAWRYAPATPELAAMIELLARHYASDLIAVTRLVHASGARGAQRFADAFKWRKEP